MPTRCVAAGCSNTPKASPVWEEQISLFTCPKDQYWRAKWISSITLKRPGVTLGDKFSICSKHFNDDDIATIN